MRLAILSLLCLCLCLFSACGASRPAQTAGSNPQLNAQLGMASVSGDAARVRALVAQGASPNIRDMMGLTPLIHASMENHPDVVVALLEGGADTETRDAFNSTALMYSVGGDGTVTRALLGSGAEMNAKDGNGNTALHHALMEKNYVVAQVLIEAGAVVSAENAEGDTPIEMAERTGQDALVQLMQGR